MGILWFVMGFWHGGVQHIFGVGLWFWFLLVAGELFSPLLERFTERLNIDTESFSWQLFQRTRTYLLYAFGALFFSASGLGAAAKRCRILFASINKPTPWIFFSESFIEPFGLGIMDVQLIIFGVMLLFAVAYLREHYEYARNWIVKQILPFRWLIWVSLFWIVLVYGKYGPGYDASIFIYGGF